MLSGKVLFELARRNLGKVVRVKNAAATTHSAFYLLIVRTGFF